MWVMTPFAIGITAGLAMLQASIAAPRDKFADCLHTAGLQAAAQQVAADQYSTFATQQCAAAGDSFKASLIAFDVKNGIKRAKAAADAQLQLDDYVAMSAEKYEAKAPKPKATPNVTPAPIPTAAPAQPKSN
jgi:hypothetical protein